MPSPRVPCPQLEGSRRLFLRPMDDWVKRVRAADPAAAAAAASDLLAQKAGWDAARELRRRALEWEEAARDPWDGEDDWADQDDGLRTVKLPGALAQRGWGVRWPGRRPGWLRRALTRLPVHVPATDGEAEHRLGIIPTSRSPLPP